MLIITSDGESKHNRGRHQDLKKNTEEERNKEKKKTFIGKNNDTGHMESHMIQRRHPRLTTEVFKFNPG